MKATRKRIFMSFQTNSVDELTDTPARVISIDRGMVVIAFLFAIYTGTAALAPVLAPHEPGKQDLLLRFLPPLSPEHVLGTDNLGRDILSRLIFGTRISLLVGGTAVLISGAVGTTLGMLGGYYGGALDDFVNWIVNIQLAFPFVLLAISVVVILGASLTNIIIVLAIAGWPAYTRVVRSKVLTLRETEYVWASRAAGARGAHILFRHIWPNLASAVIILSTLEFSRMVIAEAALSFLGLGPGGADYSSWGLMLTEGKDFLSVAWWVSTIPGLTIMTTVLAVNLIGDWLRDRLDPHLRTG